MPLRRGRGKAVPGSDPLTACLDANGTYICTAFNPRCYIIQKIAEILPYVKVTAANTPGPSLDPNADEFETKNNVDVEGWEPLPNLVYPPTDGYVYMNGDVGKLPSGAVFNNSTPDTTSNNSNTISSNVQGSEYVAVNGVTEGAEGLSPIPPSAPQENASQSSAYPLPQLKQMLSQQLEYYFSRENLANDTYLLSQMDNDQYVPIWTVANFNQVKRLTKDIKLITEVLRESPNVQVDEEGVKVRPNHKRCIVILREIPDSTPIDDVKNLFAGENCPRFISCEFAHNSSWYVTFESDEDAQRAYRYLREEVREFQGKPIMARIKAKPMNRLPIPPVTAVKNDFRATPPPTAVYDPGAFPPGQQRFIYTNGTPGQPVAYTNQVHVYSPYQQQFYASVMQWPTGGAYFDISSVFQVNGLAPQPFKPAPYRSNTRPRKQSRSNVQSDQASQGSASSSGGGGGSTGGGSGGNGPVNVRQNSQVLPSIPTQNNFKGDHDAHSTSNSSIGLPMINSDGTLEMYRLMPTPQMHISREVLPPRHRRKKRDDDNSATNTNAQSQSKEFINSRGAHFDLEDSAFPPLPGLDAGNQSIKQSSNLGNSSNAETLQTQSAVEQQTQGHWGENRLADVVKGTVKSKSSSKESSSGGENDSPRANSPQHYSHSSQTNTSIGVASSTTLTSVATVTTASTMTVNVKTTNISEHSCGKEITVSENADVQSNSCSNSNNSTLTPPNSPPETLVPVMTTKCTMADKSTKTDDALLNGDLDLPCPTTTNAATMTTIVPTEAPSRLSQVAASTSSKNCNSVHRQESKSSDTLNTKSAPSPPPNYDHSYNPPRMSYAQVAQHHKEITAQREKQLNNSNKEKQTIETSTSPGKNASSVANSNSSNSSSSRVQNDCRGEPKENGQQQQQSSQQQPQQQQQKENTNTNRNEQRHNPGSSNRNGTRSSHERSQRRRPESRTTQLRDYVTPRSPK